MLFKLSCSLQKRRFTYINSMLQWAAVLLLYVKESPGQALDISDKFCRLRHSVKCFLDQPVFSSVQRLFNITLHTHTYHWVTFYICVLEKWGRGKSKYIFDLIEIIFTFSSCFIYKLWRQDCQNCYYIVCRQDSLLTIIFRQCSSLWISGATFVKLGSPGWCFQETIFSWVRNFSLVIIRGFFTTSFPGNSRLCSVLRPAGVEICDAGARWW